MDVNQGLASSYSVWGVPTLVFYVEDDSTGRLCALQFEDDSWGVIGARIQTIERQISDLKVVDSGVEGLADAVYADVFSPTTIIYCPH